MKRRNNILLMTCLLLCHTACDSDSTKEPLSGIPLTFSADIAETRADITGGNISSMSVFAYSTGKNDFDKLSSLPNFMYNQLMTKSVTGWTYSPLKYWPLNADEKITFQAYAPQVTDIEANGDVLFVSDVTQVGFPVFTYTNNSAETDLLIAEPILNRTNANPAIVFTLKHAMTKASFYIQNLSGIEITVTTVTLKAKNTGNFTWNDEITYTSTSDVLKTYSTDAGFSLTVASGNATTYTLVKTFLVSPDPAGAILSLTYTKDGNPITVERDLSATVWAPGTPSTYILKIS